MDDSDEFTEVEQAMKHLGFTKDEKNFMFHLTTGILTLGNINFDRKTGKGNNEESSINNSQVVDVAAEFLGVNSNDLSQCLVTRSIEVRGEQIGRASCRERV